jgi:glucosyl-3-phosphoglycerate phosphatase
VRRAANEMSLVCGRESGVWLLRHAESTFNASYQSGVDPLHFDARLSVNGREQAGQLRRRLAGIADVDLVVVSPLTRALETAEIVYGQQAPMMVEPSCREWQSNSCDVGRPASVLAAEFPSLRFDHLPEEWWYLGARDWRGVAMEPKALFLERVQSFRTWVTRRVEPRIVVVGHGTFFQFLIGKALANCEIAEWSMPERQTPSASGRR